MSAENRPETERGKTPGRIVFVGVNRSELAQEKDWTWDKCQKTGVAHLAAIPLFDAMKACGLDPQKQIILNLWDDEWNLDQTVVKKLDGMAKKGQAIVGMGRAVQRELRKLGIPHIEIAHPATRGSLRKREKYVAHVKKALFCL